MSVKNREELTKLNGRFLLVSKYILVSAVNDLAYSFESVGQVL